MEQAKVHENLSLSPEAFAHAEKLAAKFGKGIRDYLPEILTEEIMKIREDDGGKITSRFEIDSPVYWIAADMADEAGMKRRCFLEKLAEQAIEKRWNGEDVRK